MNLQIQSWIKGNALAAAAIFKVRAFLYGWLASLLYSEPSSETIEKARQELGFMKEMIVFWEESTLTASFQNLLNVLAQSTPENLTVDYTGLFLGGKEGLICPSESTYIGKKFYGEATLKVMELYRDQGFVKDDSFHEPDDPIAVECVFMSVLG